MSLAAPFLRLPKALCTPLYPREKMAAIFSCRRAA